MFLCTCSRRTQEGCVMVGPSRLSCGYTSLLLRSEVHSQPPQEERVGDLLRVPVPTDRREEGGSHGAKQD